MEKPYEMVVIGCFELVLDDDEVIAITGIADQRRVYVRGSGIGEFSERPERPRDVGSTEMTYLVLKRLCLTYRVSQGSNARLRVGSCYRDVIAVGGSIDCEVGICRCEGKSEGWAPYKPGVVDTPRFNWSARRSCDDWLPTVQLVAPAVSLAGGGRHHRRAEFPP